MPFYYSQVDFYKQGIVDRSFIRREAERYCQRWSTVTRVQPGLEVLNIDAALPPGRHDLALRNVVYDISFRAHNRQQQSGVEGVARRSVAILRTPEGMFVVAEREEIITRNPL